MNSHSAKVLHLLNGVEPCQQVDRHLKSKPCRIWKLRPCLHRSLVEPEAVAVVLLVAAEAVVLLPHLADHKESGFTTEPNRAPCASC